MIVANVSKTVALDKDTGETIWESADHLAMYSTPIDFELGGAPCLAVFTKKGLIVLDRESGERLHFYPWARGKSIVNAATPVVVGERIFISSSYNHGCALLDFSSGRAEAVWESKVMRTKLSGCVLYEDHLYGFDETMLKCIDLNGKESWRKRGLGLGSLMVSDGRLILMSSRGELVVAEATPEKYRQLSRTKALDGGAYWSSPVLAGGRIYCRNGVGDLVCRDHRTP